MAPPVVIPGVPSPTPKPAPVVPPTPVPTFDASPTWGGMAQRPPVDLDVNKQLSDEAQKNAPIQYVTDADIEKAKIPTQEDFDLARKNNPGQPATTIEMRARAYARKRADDLAFTKNKQQGYKATSNNAPLEPLKVPTVTAESRGSVSETPPAAPPSKAKQLVDKMTSGGPTTKPEKTDKEKAIANAFDSGKIFDLVGGLGASLESAYGKRALADTLYGKKWGGEDTAKQELERLSKAQDYTSAEAEKQRNFEAQQNAAQRDVQLQASGAIKRGQSNRDIALRWLDTGTPLQKEWAVRTLNGEDVPLTEKMLRPSLASGSVDPLGVR